MKKDALLLFLTPCVDRVWFAVSAEKEPDKFSRAIQFYQGTKYSHALAIYYSLDLKDFVVANAHGQASQLDTIDQFDLIDEVDKLYEKDVTEKERAAFIRAVVELDGIDYSETQIFDIGVTAIFGYRPEGNGVDGIICSEYADRLAVAAGLYSAASILSKPVDLLTPKDNVKAWDAQTVTRSDFRKLR